MPEISQTLQPILATCLLWSGLYLRILAFCYCFSFLRSYLQTFGILALSLALTVAKINTVTAHFSAADYYTWARVIVTNIVAGILIAYPMVALIEALPAAARFLDILRGAHMAEQLIPGMEQRTSPLESICTLLGPCLVFATYSHHSAFLYLYSDFGNSLFGSSLSQPAIESIYSAGYQGINLSINLLAPVIIPLLIIDLGSSLIGKIVPKVNVTVEFLALKATVALLLSQILISNLPQPNFAEPLTQSKYLSDLVNNREPRLPKGGGRGSYEQ